MLQNDSFLASLLPSSFHHIPLLWNMHSRQTSASLSCLDLFSDRIREYQSLTFGQASDRNEISLPQLLNFSTSRPWCRMYWMNSASYIHTFPQLFAILTVWSLSLFLLCRSSCGGAEITLNFVLTLLIKDHWRNTCMAGGNNAPSP